MGDRFRVALVHRPILVGYSLSALVVLGGSAAFLALRELLR